MGDAEGVGRGVVMKTIEDMRREIDDQARRLVAMSAELAEIEERAKAEATTKKWEPEGGPYGVGHDHRANSRMTQELAARDEAQAFKIDAMMAWRAEDSDEIGEYAPRKGSDGVWRSVLSGFAQSFGLGLTEKSSGLLCEKLNSGEVEL